MKNFDKRQIIGWTGVVLSTAITCFWAFWGIIENFHEGWFYQSTLANLGLMFAQYLSPMLIFMGVTLISIFWSRLGGSLHVIFALFAVGFFGAFSNPVMFILIAPFIGLGALYWFGRPQPRKVAAAIAIGLPMLTLLIFAIEPVNRVTQRHNDGNLQAQLVGGNGVNLVWAPDGPGWPRTGADWNEAGQVCAQLGEDGLTSSHEPLYIWRLPTVDEAVRSMTRHNDNSGGTWDADIAQATYKTTPDKESPLWNVYSQVIYWWTATEVDDDRAYMIVYDGEVWKRGKQLSQAYFGFRCVKEP
jgi:hypothetical protein